MPEGPTIADTSCLIGLETIGRLDIFERLYARIVIPTAVAAEWPSRSHEWISTEAVANRALVQALRHRLGAGEAETIALALERDARRVVLDDKLARRLARQYTLPLTVGVILRAKERGVLGAAKPVLEELRCAGFALSEGLMAEALRLADE